MNTKLQLYSMACDLICNNIQTEELNCNVCMTAESIINAGDLHSEEDLETIRKLVDTITDTAKLARNRADVLSDTATDLAVYLVEYEQDNRESPAQVTARVYAHIDNKLQAIHENPAYFRYDNNMPTLEDAYNDCRRIVEKYDCKDVESLTRAYFEINNLLADEHDFQHMRTYKYYAAGNPAEDEQKLLRINARVEAFEGVCSIIREYISKREQARQTAVENVRRKIGGL